MNLSGHKFGFLYVNKFLDIINGQSLYECICDCGRIVEVKGKYLSNGDTRSCGCLRKIKSAENCRKLSTHGLSLHPLFKIWGSIKDRCLNPNCHAYKNYGGRGITISEEWLDFNTFFNDVSGSYKTGLQIDRFPNKNGGYSKDNFRWATSKENNRNKRTTILISVGSETKPLTQWAEETGLSRQTIYWRYKRGITGSCLIENNVKQKIHHILRGSHPTI